MRIVVEWQTRRMDELGPPGPPEGEGMIEIDARVLVDGEDAGVTDGFYLFAHDPEGSAAFLDHWDMEQWTCDIYKALRAPGSDRFRQPLPRLLEREAGILFIRLIALAPRFRGKGIGREVFQRWLEEWCDEMIGVILIHAEPLQRREGAFDYHDDEIRELPWESPEADREKLHRHLRTWGFHRIAGTPYMVTSPEAQGIEPPEDEQPGFDSDDDVPF